MNAITTIYLEMNSEADFIESSTSKDLVIIEAQIKEFRFNRYLYILVGEKWQWNDKLSWPDERWKEYAENDNLRTWVAYYKGSIAGYFELKRDAKLNVEIAYFGLAPHYIGKGFGRFLLSSAIKSAWYLCDAKRVWVHTCSLDHPYALHNYKACGLKIYHQETNA